MNDYTLLLTEYSNLKERLTDELIHCKAWHQIVEQREDNNTINNGVYCCMVWDLENRVESLVDYVYHFLDENYLTNQYDELLQLFHYFTNVRYSVQQKANNIENGTFNQKIIVNINNVLIKELTYFLSIGYNHIIKKLQNEYKEQVYKNY